MLASDYMDYRKLWLDLREFLHQKTAEDSHSAAFVNSVLHFMYAREKEQSRQAEDLFETDLFKNKVVKADIVLQEFINKFMERSSVYIREGLEEAIEKAMSLKESETLDLPRASDLFESTHKLVKQEKKEKAKNLKKRGYSYRQIGQRLGVSKTTALNWTRGYYKKQAEGG